MADPNLVNLVYGIANDYALKQGANPADAAAYARTVVAIAQGESSFNPKAVRLTDRTDPLVAAGKGQPDHSRGLFQLNYMGGRGNASGLTPEQALDPTLNTQASMPDLWRAFQRNGGGAAFNANPEVFTQKTYQLGQGSIQPNIGTQIRPGLALTAQAPAPVGGLPQFSRDNLQLTQVPPGGAPVPEDPNPYGIGAGQEPSNASPTVRIDKKTGKGYEWNRETKKWEENPLWDEPPQSVSPAQPAPIKLDGQGNAFEWSAEQRDWIRAPRWDNPEAAPSQAQTGIPRNAIPAGAVDITGTGTLFELKQGDRTITWERAGTDRTGQPIYNQSTKTAAAAPKTAIQLLTEQFNAGMAALRGGEANAAGGGPAQPAPAGGSVSTGDTASAAGPGIAPAGGGVGAIYGIDRSGNTQPVAQRIQTPGGGTADINSTSIYQTLGQWGEKPTGDFEKDAKTAAQLTLRQGMLTELAGGDPLVASRAIDAMTGGAGGRNGYYPTPQMQQMAQGTVSRSPYDGKGVKLDPSQFEAFTKVDPRDYEALYGFAEGGDVTAGLDPLEQLRQQMQQVEQSQAAPVPVSGQNIGGQLPAGAIGEDFEGNPLYQGMRGATRGPRDGGRGGFGYLRPQRDPYASGMTRSGEPFRWQGDLDRLPTGNFVSWREAEGAMNYNTVQNARRQQAMARGMPYAQAARAFPFFDPMYMSRPPQTTSGMAGGGNVLAGFQEGGDVYAQPYEEPPFGRAPVYPDVAVSGGAAAAPYGGDASIRAQGQVFRPDALLDASQVQDRSWNYGPPIPTMYEDGSFGWQNTPIWRRPYGYDGPGPGGWKDLPPPSGGIPGMAAGGNVMSGVTPAPPGAQMMTQEPIMGVGMQTGQPQFVAGEAGPENINIQPVAPPAPVTPPVTDFARMMETLMGKQKSRARATKPAGTLMLGGAGGGGY